MYLNSLTMRWGVVCVWNGSLIIVDEFESQAVAVSEEHQPERRRKLRIQRPIHATVQGSDSDGGEFNLEASLDNLSAGGLYVRLRRPVPQSAELHFRIHLPLIPGAEGPGMRFAACGLVRRVEACAEGEWGLGVEFTRYRQI